jgi:protein SCO1/2
MRSSLATLFAILTLVLGCSGARSYTLVGQVVGIDVGHGEITIRHREVAGFMPGMTMPFRVGDAELLQRVTVGDLVRATLVVSRAESHVSSIVRTGHAPLPDEPPAIPATSVLKPGEVVSGARFTDASGAGRSLSDWAGHTLAITFIYTRCPLPDFCPQMNRLFAAIQGRVAADSRLSERVRLLSISLDPDFDTPAVLASHADGVHADPRLWTFMGGSREEIDRFAVQFGVYVVRNSKTPGDITHNLRTAVIGADGRLRKILVGSKWTSDELLDALRQD